MKTIIWMTQQGMQLPVQGQQAAWLQALEAEGWSVRLQTQPRRTSWRSPSSCDYLIWGFVPTPLDVWSARLYAGKQMAVLSEVPGKVTSPPALERWCVPSESMRMHLIDGGIPQEKIEIVQGYAAKKAKTVMDIREKLHRGENAPILFAGGTACSTDARLAIWTLSILEYLRPGISLVVHTAGPDQERTRQFATSNCSEGSIYVAGDEYTTEELISQTDMVLLPLTEDGVPDALFAALKQGKPILASQQPSLMEWLRRDDNALLIPTNKPPLWAAAVDQLLNDTALSQRLSAASRHTAIPSSRLSLPSVLTEFSVPQSARSVA